MMMRSMVGTCNLLPAVCRRANPHDNHGGPHHHRAVLWRMVKVLSLHRSLEILAWRTKSKRTPSNNHVPCDFDATLDCRRVGLSSRRDLHTGVMAVIFSDAQIRTRLSAEDAVRWMGEAIDEHHRGNLVAPARSQVTVGDGQI